MDIIDSPIVMQRRALELKRKGLKVGLVPTMGYLHEGHLSLIRLVKNDCDVVVVSIFVNPTQFSPNEDLAAYPRDFKHDESLCEKEGVAIIFYPSADSMYAADASAFIDEGVLSKDLCGSSRDGHFRGVCTVVAKLFNLVQPDYAVFGEKDAQQLRVIERMVRDLNFPIEIIRGPIVREADGLAMSSRNKNLTPDQRKEALCLRRALTLAHQLIVDGECNASRIRSAIETLISDVPDAEMDYIEIVHDQTLERLERVDDRILVAIAVKFGTTRLIDNVVIDV